MFGEFSFFCCASSTFFLYFCLTLRFALSLFGGTLLLLEFTLFFSSNFLSVTFGFIFG